MRLRASAKDGDTRHRGRRRATVIRSAKVIGLFALAWTLAAGAAEGRSTRQNEDGAIDIQSASVHLRAHVYRLNADIVCELSSAAVEALSAGVPLTVMVQTEVKRERPLLDERISATETRFQLHKHTLSGRFLLTNMETGRTRNFDTIDELVENFGRLRDYPMVAQTLVPLGHRYRLRLRVSLDIESLPAVLRPLAYLNPGWRVNSGWHSWRLEQ